MTVLILAYGLIIGSFLNVCIYRVPRVESIAFPASHCPKCNTNLKWYDNIPLFSYLSLKGKCRYCGTKISPQYPVVKTLNALIYLILFFYFRFSANFVFYALISSVLIVILVIDLKDMIIPGMLVVIILGLSVLQNTLNYFLNSVSPEIVNIFLGLLSASGLFFTIIIVTKGGMGGGDVKLVGGLGFC